MELMIILMEHIIIIIITLMEHIIIIIIIEDIIIMDINMDIGENIIIMESRENNTINIGKDIIIINHIREAIGDKIGIREEIIINLIGTNEEIIINLISRDNLIITIFLISKYY